MARDYIRLWVSGYPPIDGRWIIEIINNTCIYMERTQ